MVTTVDGFQNDTSEMTEMNKWCHFNYIDVLLRVW